ncbi:MAG: alpha/beta hydrolase [Dongiaceae bacterium]
MTAPDGRIVAAGGVGTYVIERGAGPALVLLHGASLGVDAWLTWFRALPALAARFRTVTFDQPGFGRSDMNPGNRYLNRLSGCRMPGPCSTALGIGEAMLVGHRGRFMAARMATEQPDRITRPVLVTSGTAPRLGGDLDRGWMEASTPTTSRAPAARRTARWPAIPHLRRGPDPAYEAILRDNYRRARRAAATPCSAPCRRARPTTCSIPACRSRNSIPGSTGCGRAACCSGRATTRPCRSSGRSS